MAYSKEEDLLLGDMVINPSLDRQKFIDDAADEIDAKLGWLYVLPLTPIAPAVSLPGYQLLTLKGINNKLASGRLILTLDIAAEGSQLHAYGWQLVREAREELMILANGEAPLAATRIPPDPSTGITGADKIPSVKNYDEESLLTAYEYTVHRSEPWWVQPGPTETQL